MASKKVPKNVAVAWVSGDHPHGQENGEGFYEVLADDPHDHTNAQFGQKIIWEPLKKQTNNNSNELEGQFVYSGAGSPSDEKDEEGDSVG